MCKVPSQLVLFAGGMGTRLGSLGYELPKPVVPVNHRPLVSYLIDWAFVQSFSEVILAAGHLRECLVQEISKYYNLSFVEKGANTWSADLSFDKRIIIRDTGANSETAERLFAVSDLLNTEQHFVLTYADTLSDIDFAPVAKHAYEHDRLVCLVAGYPDARYGELVLDGNDVVQFKEKERPKFRINRGFFVINPRIFEHWDGLFYKSFEMDVLPTLVSIGQVVAFKSDDWFFSVDTEVDVKRLESELTKRSGLVK